MIEALAPVSAVGILATLVMLWWARRLGDDVSRFIV